MKRSLLISVLLLLFVPELKAFEFDGSVTSGIFFGTPFWNRSNLSQSIVDSGSDFYRLYNKVSIGAGHGDFSVKVNALRSDNFTVENKGLYLNKMDIYFANKHINETKIYQAYGKYDFDKGEVKLGRVMPFNRWLFASVDGGALEYDITDKISFEGFGGLDVKYGKIYDEKNRDAVAYGEVNYREENYGGKAKFMYANEAARAGLDLFGSYKGIRASGDFGFDFTNSRLFDATLALYGHVTDRFSISGNVTRFTPIGWSYQYYSKFIDRAHLGLTYKFNKDFALSFRQMATYSSENLDHLSYFSAHYKFLYAGVNYLTGDSDNERFGVSAGARYAPIRDLKLSAGVASVEYLFNPEYEERQQSMSSYLRIYYNIFDFLSVRANVNYYHNNTSLNRKWRGGLTFQYRYNYDGGAK